MFADTQGHEKTLRYCICRTDDLGVISVREIGGFESESFVYLSGKNSVFVSASVCAKQSKLS